MKLIPHPILKYSTHRWASDSHYNKATVHQDMLANVHHPLWTQLARIFQVTRANLIEAFNANGDVQIIDMLTDHVKNPPDIQAVVAAQDVMMDLYNTARPPVIFRTTTALDSMLMCTSMNGVTLSMFRPPYDRVYIDLATPVVLSPTMSVVGSYLSYYNQPSEGEDVYGVVSIYMQTANPTTNEYDPYGFPCVCVPINDETIDQYGVIDLANSATDSIIDWAERGGLQLSKEMLDAINQSFNQVIKTVIYSTWAKARQVNITPPTKAEFKAAERTKSSTKRRILEAEFAKRKYAHIILGPETFAGPKAPSDGSSGHTQVPHWREGHFRQQRHGPGNSLVKTIFIEPYFTGQGEVPVKPTYELRA